MTSIGEMTFLGCSSLKSVTISYGVKSIGSYAFQGCSNLTSVTIFDSVKSIGYHAFESCSSLTSIEIPGSVTSIEISAFEGCSSLTSIVIPDSIESIEVDAFSKSGLKSIALHDNKGYRTSSFDNLKKVVFSPGTKYASMEMFRNAPLETVVFPDSTERIVNCRISGSNEIYYVHNVKEVIAPPEVARNNAKAIRTMKATVGQCKIPEASTKSGCYIATAVYNSYDCPEVWTLRRFRDNTLAETWYGRAFVRVYYAVSPTLVKWFGKSAWFKRIWKAPLDKLVAKLRARGVENTPYVDKRW